MRYLLILILCLVQFQVQATDWLNRTVRVDLITHRQDFVRQYKFDISSDEISTRPTDSKATNGQYPWTVMTIAWTIQGGYGMGSTCAGTIIANNFVLSNMICSGRNFDPPIVTIEVFTDSVQWTSVDLPSTFVRHFWHITPTTPEDSPNIALFRLHNSLTFSPNIQPIRLPSDGNFPYEAWSSYISGFRSSQGPFSPYLLSIHASIFNNELCTSVYRPVSNHEMCGIEDPGDLSASGNVRRFNARSGGSWIVYEYTANFEYTPVLVGIYEYQFANETASFGYATRVSHFVKWIDTLTANP